MDESLESLRWQIECYLCDYEAVQKHWTELLEQRFVLLALPNPEELMKLCGREEDISGALKELVARRSELLDQGSRLGISASTLRELVSRLFPAGQSITERIQNLQFHAEALRRKSWSQWVTCQKSFLYYGQLVQLIANGGRRCSSYGSHRPAAVGGAIVDASV